VPRLRAVELTLKLPPVMKTGKLFCDNDTLRALLLLPALTSTKERLRRLRCNHALTDSGADRDRTDDLRLAKPALSQLSYSPERACSPEAKGSDAYRRQPARSRDGNGATISALQPSIAESRNSVARSTPQSVADHEAAQSRARSKPSLVRRTPSIAGRSEVAARFRAWGTRKPEDNVVGQGRLELPTSRLSGVRSNHLSYWPGRHLIAWASGYRGIAQRTRAVPENRVLSTTSRGSAKCSPTHFEYREL
jgi:hypothetical protein